MWLFLYFAFLQGFRSKIGWWGISNLRPTQHIKSDGSYLVIRPLQGAGISEDNRLKGVKDCSKKGQSDRPRGQAWKIPNSWDSKLPSPLLSTIEPFDTLKNVPEILLFREMLMHEYWNNRKWLMSLKLGFFTFRQSTSISLYFPQYL